MPCEALKRNSVLVGRSSNRLKVLPAEQPTPEASRFRSLLSSVVSHHQLYQSFQEGLPVFKVLLKVLASREKVKVIISLDYRLIAASYRQGEQYSTRSPHRRDPYGPCRLSAHDSVIVDGIDHFRPHRGYLPPS